MANAYQTNQGLVLGTAITSITYVSGTGSGSMVIIYIGTKEHVYYQGADALDKYNALVGNLGVTVVNP